MAKMIPAVIESVRVSLISAQRIIILKEKDGERHLPIWVGASEAEAITVALQEVEVARPFTHDLLKNVFALFKSRIQRIEIHTLQEDVFFANIIAEQDGKPVKIDSRPSDAIALAVRAHVPILIADSVLEEAGILPEKDLAENGNRETPEDKPPVEGEPDQERLKVFEDYLKKLDQDGGNPAAGRQ